MGESTTVQRLVDWADGEPGVRAVFLVGSRGENGGRPDRLSDHDVLAFFRDRATYRWDESWLISFGDVLVKLHEEYEVLGATVPTRLVQYRDGTRIDFSLGDLSLLERMCGEENLPPLLDAGFRVLIDKDGRASRLPEPSGNAGGEPPTAAGYRALVDEFWWEAIYVAKHLARDELLPARYSHDCVMRFRCLVPMLEWYARAAHGWDGRIGPHGRGLGRVLQKGELARLRRTSLGWSVEEGWDALLATAEYFRDVSDRVANRCGFAPRDELAEGVGALLREMRGGRPGPP